MTEDELMAAYSGARPVTDSTEDELLAAVSEAMTLTGWRWMHVRRSDLAIVMGAQGFPDLIAVRDGVVLAFELKAQRGRPTPDQLAWLRAWGGAGAFACIVRPSDLDELLLYLTGKRPGVIGALMARTWGPGAFDGAPIPALLERAATPDPDAPPCARCGGGLAHFPECGELGA